MTSKDIYKFIKQQIILLDRDTPWSKAMLAKLRRAAGKTPGLFPDIWEVSLPVDILEENPKNKNNERAEKAVHVALTLYALHKQGKREKSMNYSEQDEKGNDKGYSFGKATAQLIRNDVDRKESIIRRFNAAATSTDIVELSWHSRGIVQFLKDDDITMSYPRFAEDLYIYQIPGQSDSVRLKWGEDFYRVLNYMGKDDTKE